LTYQWSKDSQLIVGATGPVLAITNAARSDGGLYQVTVRDSAAGIRMSVGRHGIKDGKNRCGVCAINIAVAAAVREDCVRALRIGWQPKLNEQTWGTVTNAAAGAGTNRVIIRAPLTGPQQFYRIAAE
jgi:hypothetical protein